MSTTVCPRCNNQKMEEPIETNSVTKIDGKTWICNTCGKLEVLIEFYKSKGVTGKISDKELELEKKFKERIGGKK